MCGIGGYYRTGISKNTAPEWAKPAMRDLWDNLQARGSDASGIAYESPTGTRHYKRDIPAFELSPLATNMAFGMNRGPQWVMLHTRASTHGSPEYNKNNHPLMGHNLALCHNGVVYNKDDVLKHYHTVAQREVDTEAILIALKKGGINAVSKHVKGSMSISWAKGKTMHLWTNGKSPLVIGELYNGDFMYASTDELLMTTNLKFKRVYDAKKGHLYKFTPTGLRVSKTYFKEEKENMNFSWRNLSGFEPVSRRITYTKPTGRQEKLVVPKVNYIHKRKKLRHQDVCNPSQQYDSDVCNPSKEYDVDYDWDSVYGDWRTWEKKSKQIKEWEDEQ